MDVSFVSQPWERLAAPDLGSIELQTYGASSRLARWADVRVYCRAGKGLKRRENIDGVEFHRYPSLHENRLLQPFERLLFRNRRRPLIASGFYHASYIRQIAADLRERASDIIHVHNFSQYVPLVRAAAPSAKIVLHMHCEWLTEHDPEMIQERLAHVDAVICCSEFVAGRIRQRFPQFATKCQAVYNGIDVDRFQPAAGTSRPADSPDARIVYVGRVSPEKGVHVLLQAFNRVLEKFPHAQLNIVGPEWIAPLDPDATDDALTRDLASFRGVSYGEHLRRIVRAENAGRVTFTGFLNQAELAELYRGTDIFVFPSVWHEPFGIPVMEAMASGVPVVATRSGGIVEQVDHQGTGLLVERGDTEQLAASILHLLDNPDLRRAMGKAARQKAVRGFGWNRNVENLLGLYRNLTDGVFDRPKVLRSFGNS
jgi:glycosyltransferase involved in cell wall biosynthesis